ncbi:MAG TPA: VOC family protein, partial [Candidatus Angelobacter sp.]|nr:VOC family protein [Candidatus Angelobacter sp.]
MGEALTAVLAIDHVVVPVADLVLAASEIESRYGLASIDGGRHPAWGTANRVIPLGDCYVELVAIADPETAAGTAFGSWIASAEVGRPLGWAVRTTAIDAVERRLGLTAVPGFRATPGGMQITWRSAGVDVAAREPALPFFIQWGDG